MIDISDVRRQQLRRLVNDHEGMSNLAKKLGLTRGAHISQLLSDPPLRVVSEKTARKWERILRLPEGWIDGRVANAPGPLSSVQPLNVELLTSAIADVLDMIKDAKVSASPVQIADLVAMTYQDGLPAGRVDTTRLKRMISLMR